jgi:branched-chain amino acid transport system ATP-binding protein
VSEDRSVEQEFNTGPASRLPGDENIDAKDSRHTALLIDGVSVTFTGVHALDTVTLSVPDGERHAIIGPNGAGKTTLFNAISGVVPIAAGRMRIFDNDVTRMAPHRRVALGMTRTFQISQLFPGLSVYDNALLGAQAMTRSMFSVIRPAQHIAAVAERADRILQMAGLWDQRSVTAEELSHGGKRRLELSLAASTNPRVLLLDEPAAGLGVEEAGIIIQELARLTSGITVVIIEHDIDLVLSFADRITVLNHGKILAQGTPGEIRDNLDVQKHYFGEA